MPEEGHSSVNSVAFSPGGKQLASASDDKTIRLWDTGSGTVLQTLKGHSSYVNAVVFSPDGKQLASASEDKTIRLWDIGSGTMLQTLKGHSSWVYAVAFSPDGKQLASGSYDMTIRLWDADLGTALRTLYAGFVKTLSFSDNNTSLQTDIGTFPISPSFSNDTVTFQSQFASSIFLQDQWVGYDTERILWLPPEYRPGVSATYKNIVCLGASSGRVTFIEFAF